MPGILTQGLSVVAALIVIGSAAKADQADYQDASYGTDVPAGQKKQIGYERSWNPACESTGASITITRRPAHGAVSMDKVISTLPDKAGDCAGEPATSTRVFYTPGQGFQGTDHVSWNAAYGNGGHRHTDVEITVMAGLLGAGTIHSVAGQVFRSIPAAGSLNAPPGTAVFIDDGSCPTGQIRQMIVGSVQRHIPRTFACVQR